MNGPQHGCRGAPGAWCPGRVHLVQASRTMSVGCSARVTKSGAFALIPDGRPELNVLRARLNKFVRENERFLKVIDKLTAHLSPRAFCCCSKHI
jgi:hypothetical protein